MKLNVSDPRYYSQSPGNLGHSMMLYISVEIGIQANIVCMNTQRIYTQSHMWTIEPVGGARGV